jgi:hypothetical protein
MAYSKAKLKGSGDRASPCFRPFWIGKLSDKCLPIQTLLYVSLKHILINLTGFMGTPNSMREYCTKLPYATYYLKKNGLSRNLISSDDGV